MNYVSTKLKEVADFVNGKAFKPSDWSDSGIPIIRIQNLNNSGKSFNYWSGSCERQVKVKKNDLLLAWSGTPGTSFGAHIWQGDDAVLNQHIFRVDLNQTIITKEWAKLLINSKLNLLIGMSHGGVGLKHVTKGMVEELEIELPPLPEQKRIATILDKADELKRKREAAIAKLDQLAQSIFVEMFGDSITNKLHWPEKQLGDITVGKPNNGIFKKNEEYSEGLPVAWVEELFRSDKLELDNSRQIAPTKEELEKYGLDYGDILFCRSSLKLDGIGFNNVYLGIKNHALFECHLIRIKPNKELINPIFLNFMLRTPAARQNIKKQAKTVTMTTIDQDGLLRTKIILPPLTLQNKFADIFQKIVGLKITNMRQLERAKLLFASLQHQAFAGQL